MLPPVTVRFPKLMMDQIDAIQAERIDGPEKAQVIRELVALGLRTLAKKQE